MKKILIIFLLSFISYSGYSQTNLIKWLRITFDTKIPLDYDPSATGNAIQTVYYNIHPGTGLQMRNIKNTTSWVQDSIFKGMKGDQGVQGVQGITGPIGNTGSQGIQGIPGPQGPPGSGGGSISAFITPEQYGAIAGDGQDDTQALQNCFNNAIYKVIIGSGVYNTTAQINRSKTFNTVVKGNASIQTLNNGTYAALGCLPASSENEAIQMQSYRLDVEGWSFALQSNQIGIKPGPGSNHYFRNLTIVGGTWGMYLEFCLKARLDDITVLGSTNGYYIGWGGFPGSTQNNAQSNGTRLNTCHTHSVSNVGFKIDQTYHVNMEGCIIEGNGTIFQGVNVDLGQSTTSKDFSCSNLHMEQTGGCTDAIFKLNLFQATAIITAPIAHYNGTLIDATSGSGQSTIELRNFEFAPGQTSTGKLFKSNNIGWFFYLCRGFYPSSLTNSWVGTPATHCTSFIGGCGYNYYGLISR